MELKLFIVGVKNSNKETHFGPSALTFRASVYRNPDFKIALSESQGKGVMQKPDWKAWERTASQMTIMCQSRDQKKKERVTS